MTELCGADWAQDSACAKFILCGEHSVVHKGQALCFPLNQCRIQIHSEEFPEGSARTQVQLNKEELSLEALNLFFGLCENLGIDIKGQKINIKSQIPVGAGLGSSAAVCVALLRHYKKLSGQDLAMAALQGENFLHGKASGVDPFCVAFEKPMAFQSSDLRVEYLDCKDFIVSPYCFALFDSRERRSTKNLVNAVNDFASSDPKQWSSIINDLANITDKTKSAFEAAHCDELAQNMLSAQKALHRLGVSTEKIDGLCHKLTEPTGPAAKAAKLSGAGGGGFVLALFEKTQLKRAESRGLLPSKPLVWPMGSY